MFKWISYPAVVEPTGDGYSVYFPDLPGAVSAGDDYEDAIKNAKECLSLHLEGMINNDEKLPKPSNILEVEKELIYGEFALLIHLF